MYNNDSHSKSKHYLRTALEMIGKHGLSPEPMIYHVWYEYAAGQNETLNAAIDRYLQENKRLSENILHQIYNQHIADGEQKITSLVKKQLKTVLTEIIETITSADNHFTGSSENLTAIQKSIDLILSETDLEAIIGNIKKEISGLKSTNDAFREQLQQASEKISELNEKLAQYHEQAHKDALTRLDNRRSFEKKLVAAIVESDNAADAVCLILADIDHFKKINDTHGHLVGDKVLKMVAATIKESVKGRDTVARVGGEEFAILLTGTPIEGAVKVANDIRSAFERLDLKKRNTGERIGQITLSFGVARYHSGEDVKDFINRADVALYQSKENGRNRVTVQPMNQN